jgi:hypothetical protein
MKLTQYEYVIHTRDYDGYCTACDAITNFGGVEPDAEEYCCDNCEQHAVMGVEQAMIAGKIEFIEEN